MQHKKPRKINLITCLICEQTIPHPTWGVHLKYQHQMNGAMYQETFHLKQTPAELIAEGAVSCAMCGLAAHELTSHITRTHKMTVSAYRLQYPAGDTHSQKYLAASSTRIKGANNPAHQHGGRLSPFSEKFIHYKPGLKELTTEKARQSRLDNTNVTTTLAYWLKQTGGNVEDAEMLLKYRQSTFTLDKCIAKLGQEAGTARWLERQLKWQTTLNEKSDDEKAIINKKKLHKNGITSKAELEIFAKLVAVNSNIEHQFCIPIHNSFYLYDFKFGNKIVEYNGDYWHAHPDKYTAESVMCNNMSAKDVWEKDRNKILHAASNGYEVLVVWERDYKQDPKKVISECLSFLTA